jgi:hypothetical protein
MVLIRLVWLYLVIIPKMAKHIDKEVKARLEEDCRQMTQDEKLQ